jgi:hypothetical protein
MEAEIEPSYTQTAMNFNDNKTENFALQRSSHLPLGVKESPLPLISRHTTQLNDVS